MTRTKRIYNSYRQWGRFMHKSDYGTDIQVGEKWLRGPPQPYPVGVPFEDSRWTPYIVWCMGHCRGCRKQFVKENNQKQTVKHKVLKFDQAPVWVF